MLKTALLKNFSKSTISKAILVMLLSGISVLRTFADEGMWLPMLLGQQVYNDMVKKGLKLSKEQLYSVNKASIKDAVVIFGGGCTGEIVSNEGLIFTNHHCGYSAITNASSIEHNYLQNGFYAMKKTEEIPSSGLSVQFLLKIDDVTKDMEAVLGGLTGDERAKKQSETIAGLNQKYSDTTQSIEARVSPIFKGNQFLVFIYQRIKISVWLELLLRVSGNSVEIQTTGNGRGTPVIFQFFGCTPQKTISRLLTIPPTCRLNQNIFYLCRLKE